MADQVHQHSPPRDVSQGLYLPEDSHVEQRLALQVVLSVEV